MAHTVPFSPLERDLFGAIVACETVAYHTLAARFEEQIAKELLERTLERWQRSGLVVVFKSSTCSHVSITREGVKVWEVADGDRR